MQKIIEVFTREILIITRNNNGLMVSKSKSQKSDTSAATTLEVIAPIQNAIAEIDEQHDLVHQITALKDVAIQIVAYLEELDTFNKSDNAVNRSDVEVMIATRVKQQEEENSDHLVQIADAESRDEEGDDQLNLIRNAIDNLNDGCSELVTKVGIDDRWAEVSPYKKRKR